MIEKIAEIKWNMCPPECPAHCLQIAEKLNEVIDVVNSQRNIQEDHFELAALAKKAATTGNREDLHNYLERKREIGL